MTQLRLYQDRKKNWRWQLKASNNKILCASSEGFSTKQNAKKNFGLVGKAVFMLAINGADE